MQALVRPHLVLVARVLVAVRRADREALDLGRQRHRAAHVRAGALGRLDDLTGRVVDQAVIERLEPDADLLSAIVVSVRCLSAAGGRSLSRLAGYSRIFGTTPAPTVRPPSRMAKRRPSSIAIGADQLDHHLDVVARHHHLHAFRQLARARHVRRAEVELRTVALEERRVTAALFLRQHVHLGLELRVRRDRARLAPAPGRARRLRASCRAAARRRCRPPGPGPAACGTSPRPCTIVFCVGADADDLDFVAHLDDAALDATRSPPCRGPRSRTRLPPASGTACRSRAPAPGCSVSIASTSFMIAGTPISLWSPSSAFSAEPLMIGVSSPGNSYLRQQLAHFHLDQLEQLRVVDHVRLVQEHHDVRHADLARQQDVLARLRHRAVRGRAPPGSRRPSAPRR